ncbi:MAG: AI-2E family transporter [Thermomicrobiales bacterium]|nr:AI-2E family transporter [Thermomicrobiales bacterium]MCO5222083.1 AI-2E family transporter [Thermomicrobiales bacterium]
MAVDDERVESRSATWRDFQPRHLVTIVIVLILLAILYLSRGKLGPYLLAITLSYLLLPVVRTIERRMPSTGRMATGRRPIATLLSMVLVATASILLGAFLIEPVIDDVQEIADSFPQYWEQATTESRLGEWYVEYVPADAQTWIDGNLSNLAQTLLGAGTQLLNYLFSATGSLIEAVLALIIVPVFMIYVLIDRPRAGRSIRKLMPERWVDDTLAVAGVADGILAAYTRGVIISSAVVGAITAAGYWAVGIELWLALGVIAFLGEIVPILGPWIAFVISFPVVLVTQPDKAIWAVLVFGVIQALEGWFISPKIQSDSIEFPPVIVLLALAIGGEVAGAVGVVLAIPAAAILRALAVYILRRVDGLRPEAAVAGLLPSGGMSFDWRSWMRRVR